MDSIWFIFIFILFFFPNFFFFPIWSLKFLVVARSSDPAYSAPAQTVKELSACIVAQRFKRA